LNYIVATSIIFIRKKIASELWIVYWVSGETTLEPGHMFGLTNDKNNKRKIYILYREVEKIKRYVVNFWGYMLKKKKNDKKKKKKMKNT